MRRLWYITAIFSVSGFLVLVAYVNDIRIQTEIAHKRIQPDIDDLEEFHKKDHGSTIIHCSHMEKETLRKKKTKFICGRGMK